MHTVSLRRLILQDFRSFRGHHEVVFPDHGLVHVVGDNRDTRGDSGAGKTNLLKSIQYLLDSCNVPGKYLQCWQAEQTMWVEGHFESHEGPVVIRRSPKGYSVKVGTQTLEGDAKAARERIRRLFGVDADLREALTYRDQRKPRRFLAMTNSQKKEFLTTVLGLQRLEDEVKTGAKELRALSTKLQLDAGSAATAEGQLMEVPPLVLQDLTEWENQVMDSLRRVEDLELQLQGFQEQYDTALKQEGQQIAAAQAALQDELQGRQEALQRARDAAGVVMDGSELERLLGLLERCQGHLTAVETTDATLKYAYERQTQDLRQQARVLHNEVARLPSLRTDVQRLTAEMEQLRADVCPTCDRTWENAQEKLRSVEQQLTSLKRQIAVVEDHHPRVQELEREILARQWTTDPRVEKLHRVKNGLQEQVAVERQRLKGEEAAHRSVIELALAAVRETQQRIKGAAAEIVANRDRPVAKAQTSIVATREELAELKLNEQKARGELRHRRDENGHRKAVHNDNLKRRRQQELVLQVAQETVRQTRSQHCLQADYLESLQGFRNRVFDEVLREIGTEATAILQGLPNAQHISLEFRSQWETDDEVLRDEIREFAFIHGEERPLEEVVSGGQYTSVELAVDLAVGSVVGRRHGCHIGWMILDESFNGHDHVTKQGCLEVLQQYASDRLVIVVDHHNEFRDAFQQTITVVCQDKFSHLEVKNPRLEGAQ